MTDSSLDRERRRLSLWWDTLPDELRTTRRAPLEGNRDTDVVIVGAGYTGLWTAYYLLHLSPGIRITILEAETAGFGASGRNGGWCSALFPSSWAKVARDSAREDAVRLQRELFSTIDEIGRVIQFEGIDAHWAKGGTITAARTDVQVQRAHESIDEARNFGFGVEDYRWLEPGEAVDVMGASSVLGATFTPHCAAIHPARLVRGLAEAVEKRGATIYEDTRALAIEPGSVTTDRGTVTSDYVVLATEGYTPEIAGHRRDVAPVYSLMLATEPLPTDVWDAINLNDRPTFNDLRHLIVYGQRTADDRLAFGGRGAPYHFGSRIKSEYDRDTSVYSELRRVLIDLFPPVRDAAITHTWGGPIGVPRDWFASVNLDRNTGLARAGGYVGDGVGTSNLAGRTLADLIMGIESDIVDLPWVGHQSPLWEPEPLRWVGANAGLHAMSTADSFENRTGRPSRRAKFFGRFIGH